MSQYAHKPDSKTIHSKSQLEHFGSIIHDSTITAGGHQMVVTHEGYAITLHVRNGLYYMDMSPATDTKLEHFPHVFLTANSPWNPNIVDDEFFFDASDTLLDNSMVHDCHDARDTHLKLFGSQHTHSINHGDTIITRDCLDAAVDGLIVSSQTMKCCLPDLDTLLPNFGWVSKERIHDTLTKTSQHYQANKCVPMRKHFQSQFPAANVHRLNEWYSTDTFIAKVPAFDDGIPGHGGCKMMQIYGGLDSELLAGFPLASESDLPDTLRDFIREYGAMEGLKSDNAKSETSFTMKNIFCMYMIKDRLSEPHYQHQNPIERRIQDLKRMMHGIMDRVGCSSGYWLLCLLYVIGLLNVLSNSKGCIPLTVVTGHITDISPYLDFHFWQEVFVEVPGGEQLARWCGPSHKQGDFLTYFVLLDDTKQLVTCSIVRTAKDLLFPNHTQRPNPSDGDTRVPASKPVVSSIQDYYEEPVHLPTFSPDELLGMTILKDNGGELVHAKVVRKIMDHDAENHDQIKFLLGLGDGQLEELISYNELSDLVTESLATKESGQQDFASFSGILDHQGPLKAHDPQYKGSSYSILVSWDDGSQTWEPINLIGKQDPVMIARYGHDNGLLNKPGWKFLRCTAKRQRFINAIMNAIKRRNDANQVRYKFGIRVPRTYGEAMTLDKESGNNLWGDATRCELEQIFSYKSFRDLGSGGSPGEGYKKIKVRLVFATYGSEFMAARQAVEQIIDLWYTLRMFGVPIDGASWLFGNNKLVVTSSTIPHSTLNKRWNASSYHKVREAVAGDIIRFEHIPTGDNPADILTKSLPWHKAWVHVEPLLFWKGETATSEGSDKQV